MRAGARALVGVLEGMLDRRAVAQVDLPGGKLEIKWTDKGSLLMTGPAERVFSQAV